MTHIAHYGSLAGITTLILCVLLPLALAYFLKRITGIRIKSIGFYSYFLLIISLFALLYSQFHTILLPVPIITIWLIIKEQNLKNKDENQQEKWYWWLFPIALIVLFYSYHYLRLDYFFMPTKFYADQLFYGRLSSYIRDFGIENNLIDYFRKYEVSDALTPYHYVELWFAAAISKSFDVHSMFALNGIIYPLMYCLLGINFYFLFKELGVFSISNNGHSFFLMFYSFSSIFLFLPDLGSSLGMKELALSNWLFPLYGYHKLIFLSVLFVMQIRYLISKKYLPFVLVSVLLVLSNIAVSIAVTLGCFVFLFLEFKKGLISFKKLLSLTSILMFTTLYVFVFYKLNGISEKDSVALTSNEIFIQYSSVEFWITCRNIFFKTILQTFFSLLPLLIFTFFFLKRRKDLKQFYRILSYLASVFFSGLIAYSLLHPMRDAVQLWSLVASISTSLIVLLTLLLVISQISINALKNILILAITLFSIYNSDRLLHKNHNQVDLTKFSRIEILEDEPTFAFLRNESDYMNRSQQYESVYFGQAYELFDRFDPLRIICLSTDNLSLETEEEIKYSNFLQFNRYRMMRNFLGSNIDSSRKKFIYEYSIDYLLVSEHATFPSYLADYFNDIPLGMIDSYTIYSKKITDK